MDIRQHTAVLRFFFLFSIFSFFPLTFFSYIRQHAAICDLFFSEERGPPEGLADGEVAGGVSVSVSFEDVLLRPVWDENNNL